MSRQAATQMDTGTVSCAWKCCRCEWVLMQMRYSLRSRSTLCSLAGLVAKAVTVVVSGVVSAAVSAVETEGLVAGSAAQGAGTALRLVWRPSRSTRCSRRQGSRSLPCHSCSMQSGFPYFAL